MKNIIPLLLSISVFYSCSDDDTTTSVSDPDDSNPEIENLVYDETVDGDLSNTSTTPTAIPFSTGENVIVAEQVLGDADYFTFEVPEGYELSEIIVEDFNISDQGFIGIQSGTAINGNTEADLLGGSLYGQTNIDSDILPALGTLTGATGFTGALPAGDYTIWLNQTGEASTAILNFVISETEVVEEEEEIENLVYDEAIDGDLSNTSTAPTAIPFSTGENVLVAEQVLGNADYFTFEVPEGYELSEIIVEDFNISDQGFIGIQSGTAINGDTEADLLGGSLYGQTNIDSDILPELGTLTGVTGFTGALPAGDYTIWLNQTGEASTAILNFVISETEVVEEEEIENLVYDESVEGDLSNTSTAPTAISFSTGENMLVAEQVLGDADYFTFEVPEGYELSEIIVEDFNISDRGFIGIQSGTAINGNTEADLLGGSLYGQTNIDSDILPALGTLTGATGFTGALPAGNYTIWLNQTGEASTVELNFVINLSSI